MMPRASETANTPALRASISIFYAGDPPGPEIQRLQLEVEAFLEVAILNLQMLGVEERAFRPDDRLDQ
jgi:hypothetical protein